MNDYNFPLFTNELETIFYALVIGALSIFVWILCTITHNSKRIEK